jgi:hypothetical protein
MHTKQIENHKRRPEPAEGGVRVRKGEESPLPGNALEEKSLLAGHYLIRLRQRYGKDRRWFESAL